MTQPAVYVVSDSTGETAELVTRAALSQFGQTPKFIHRFHHVDSSHMIEEIVDLVAVNNGIIVHTIVLERSRRAKQNSPSFRCANYRLIWSAFKPVRGNV